VNDTTKAEQTFIAGYKILNKIMRHVLHVRYFSSSTTTEAGGSFTCNEFVLRVAPVNEAGFILSGSSNVLWSCMCCDTSILPVTCL
jgi:hypothetical protein